MIKTFLREAVNNTNHYYPHCHYSVWFFKKFSNTINGYVVIKFYRSVRKNWCSHDNNKSGIFTVLLGTFIVLQKILNFLVEHLPPWRSHRVNRHPREINLLLGTLYQYIITEFTWVRKTASGWDYERLICKRISQYHHKIMNGRIVEFPLQHWFTFLSCCKNCQKKEQFVIVHAKLMVKVYLFIKSKYTLIRKDPNHSSETLFKNSNFGLNIRVNIDVFTSLPTFS